VRRILAGLTAFLALTATLLVVPVYAAPLPEPEPVETATDEVQMGSVADPAGEADVQAGTSDPVAGVPATAPTLTVTRTDVAEFSLVGVTWAFDPEVTDTLVQVRVQDAAGAWGEWTEVGAETADQGASSARTGAELRGGTSPLWTGPSRGVDVELVTRSGAQPTDVQLDLVDPGESEADAALDAAAVEDTAHAATAMPSVYSRAQWGADESIRTWAPQYVATVKAATLHHTADTNDYTADQVPAMMRSIYRYHTVSLGWGDIGYNVIVDKFGRLWEGRFGGLSSTVVGAHAGGFNTSTFGVSMLGNYDVVPVPQVTVDAVAAIIAWKFSLFGIDPRGTTSLTSGGGGTAKYAAGTKVTLPTIFGHRDVGSTACPGRYGYARLGEIRDRAAAITASSVSPLEQRLSTDAALRSTLGAAIGPEVSSTGTTWREYQFGRLYWSAATGTHVMRGAILAAYLQSGGPAAHGLPTNDETPAGGGRGQVNHLSGGASIYWSPATGARLVQGAIADTYRASGRETGPLGFPVSDEIRASGGAVSHFEFGDVYWSPATGAHLVVGRIRDVWLANGGVSGGLGYPITDERSGARGIGRYSEFTGGTVYWTPADDAQVIKGAIRAGWKNLGGDAGPLGTPRTEEIWSADRKFLYTSFTGGVITYTAAAGPKAVHGLIAEHYQALGGVTSTALGIPVTSEMVAPGDRARYNHFSASASIYWSAATGAHEVHGNIRLLWGQLGWEASPLGLPITDELVISGGRGRYNAFVNGLVMYSPQTGTHEVLGDIARRYAAMGREASSLGYPVSGEYSVPGGRRSDFQHGSLTWSAVTGQITLTTR
jgi:uncharacterized protein with LGFP repeats